MKGILVAVIITAFVVAAVESLSCVQCNSVTNPCENSSVSQCPDNANASCTSLVARFSQDPDHTYQDKACSVDNCLEERDMVETIIVHVSDTEYFHFTSQCCQGKKCNDTSDAPAPPLEDSSSNIECPACYGSNESSCSVKSRKCHKEEQCVDLVAEFKNETKKLVLKGCSKISNSTCQFLSAENQTIGGIIFRKFKCVEVPQKSSVPNGIKCPACYNVYDISCDPVLLACTGTETKHVEVIGIVSPIFVILPWVVLLKLSAT